MKIIKLQKIKLMNYFPFLPSFALLENTYFFHVTKVRVTRLISNSSLFCSITK
jgi:hypothetical protein